MASPDPRKKKSESFQLKDDWDGSGSVFTEKEDGRSYQQEKPKEEGADPTKSSVDAGPESASKVRREVKLQTLGRQIVSNLYMLVRNVKLHAPDNQVFLKPIEQLREAMNAIVALERQFNLQAVATSILLNNTSLKFDFAALDNVKFLTREFEQRDIGGLSTKRPVTTQEIRDFLHMFTPDFQGSFKDEGALGHEMPSLRVTRFSVVKELLDKLDSEPDPNEQVDRKKYLMTVYSRTVYFMRRFFESASEGELRLPFAKAGRLVQDFVDLCHAEKTHFLGVTTTRCESEYLSYHSVNIALLSIVFGSELGLDKRQLHDLGMAALFSQIGLLTVPESVLSKAGRLTPEERALIDMHPLRSAKQILQARGLDRTTMQRIVATYESKIDYAIPQKMPDGETQLIMPKVGLGVFGKIISIVDCFDALTSKRPFRDAYGPEIALALMSSGLKYKFDPVFLRIFMKVMAIQPIRILSKSESTLKIG